MCILNKNVPTDECSQLGAVHKNRHQSGGGGLPTLTCKAYFVKKMTKGEGQKSQKIYNDPN